MPRSWYEDVLFRAFEQDFLLYRQAIVNLTTLETRYEILIRRRDSTGKIISGGQVIEECEQNGSILFMDRWVFDRMIAYIISTNDPHHYSINLSPFSLNHERSQQLIQHIWSRLSSSGVGPTKLGFEITERGCLNWKHETRDFSRLFNFLRLEGYKIALDDFGMGHSLMDLTDRIHPTSIKIDGQYIQRIGDERVERLLWHIIQICKDYGAEVTAEWVESPQLLDIVRDAKFNWAQGYAIGYEEILPLAQD